MPKSWTSDLTGIQAESSCLTTQCSLSVLCRLAVLLAGLQIGLRARRGATGRRMSSPLSPSTSKVATRLEGLLSLKGSHGHTICSLVDLLRSQPLRKGGQRTRRRPTPAPPAVMASIKARLRSGRRPSTALVLHDGDSAISLLTWSLAPTKQIWRYSRHLRFKYCTHTYVLYSTVL